MTVAAIIVLSIAVVVLAFKLNAAERNLTMADRLLDGMSDRLRATIEDNPEFDATDAAHPAWWRGHCHTAKVFCQLANEILDGKDVSSGISGEPWQSLKIRLSTIAKQGQGDQLVDDGVTDIEIGTAEMFEEFKELRKAARCKQGRAIAKTDQWEAEYLDKIKSGDLRQTSTVRHAIEDGIKSPYASIREVSRLAAIQWNAMLAKVFGNGQGE